MIMNFTIHVWHILLGLNLIALITFFAWPRQSATGYGAIGDAMIEMVYFGLIVIASLVMWLIYAFARLA